MIMSLSCVNAYSADENKVIIEKENFGKEGVEIDVIIEKKEAEDKKKETTEKKKQKRRKMNRLEILILLESPPLR
jgi:hypothetical protein